MTICRPRRRAHRDIEQGKKNATVREFPAVGQFVANLNRHHGTSLLPVLGAGTQQLEKRNFATEEPPSTTMYCPVMCRDASEARSAIVPFRSSGPPNRRSGVAATILSSIFSSNPRVIFEGKNPGQMAFTLMLYWPHSAANARVKLIAAALLVL